MNFVRLSFLFILFISCTEPVGQTSATSVPGTAFYAPIISQVKTPLPQSYITEEPSGFPLAGNGSVAPILISREDHPGIERIARLFQNDLANVTGIQPELLQDSLPASGDVIIIGSLQSPLISHLIESGKLTADLEGKWEQFIIQTVRDPWEGIDQALVIAGSDKRGTIYGMFDMSEKMGVSPWYWWADVPVVRRTSLYVTPGTYTKGEPKVKYRGIFINDEAPALAGWAYEKFGGFNHHFYDKVFELILRLKGNYLWPAMWGRAIYDDDSLSPALADEYGVVIGTSHHEPLMRAHVEWERYGEGPWNYEENEERLREFWKKGIKRMGDNESIVTIGMRGDGDEPMTERTAIDLLERIVKDQREIIAGVTGKPAGETPQIWALYKEVQDYYDKGMRVPDDVTLLLCDDNWGNIRKLPARGDSLRAGGYGIYYHYDYVGGPRNYKWINTNQISRVWEQMHLAYAYHARQIWIVNVGDIKPMEFPTSFFLEYAWDPEQISAADIPAYGVTWATQTFGETHAEPIAEILHEYTQLNSRRKPELLSSETYSLVHFREFERVVMEYTQLAERADSIGRLLPAGWESAYFQLILHPVRASANLNELYYTVAKNRLYAAQGRVVTNALAKRAEELFGTDQQLSEQYHQINSGKWNHMMSQTHIGYTYWQQPEEQVMPDVETIRPAEEAEMGVAVEGSESWWPDAPGEPWLPEIDSRNEQERLVEIYNRGLSPFAFSIEAEDPFLKFSETRGTIEEQKRIVVQVDWAAVKAGNTSSSFTISGAGQQVVVRLNLSKTGPEVTGKYPDAGAIAFEAAGYAEAVGNEEITWLEIPQLGRTRSGMTPVPVTASPQKPVTTSGPYLRYALFIPASGTVEVKAYFSPTLNFHNDEGLEYAVSFDEEQPQLVNLHAVWTPRDWADAVSNNVIIKTTTHSLPAGNHSMYYRMVDPGVVLQKIVVLTGKENESYLGAPTQ